MGGRLPEIKHEVRDDGPVVAGTPVPLESDQQPSFIGSGGKIFLGLFLLSFFLRSLRVNQGLGFDEIFSLQFFWNQSWTEIVTRMPLPNNHPLYSLLAHLFLRLLGESEWVLRLPSLVLGSLTPPLLFLVGRRWLGERVGILAGVLMSIGFWPLWRSTDARGYGPMVFFSLLATGIFLDLSVRFRLRSALAFVLASIAAVYFHLYAGFMAAAFGVVSIGLAARERGDKKLAATCLIAAGLSALLYLPFVPDLSNYMASRGKVIHQAGHAVSLSLLKEVFLDWPLGPYLRSLSWPMTALAAVGVAAAWRKSKPLVEIHALALAAALIVPALVSAFVFRRFYCFSSPAFFLFVAAGAVTLWGWLDKKSPGVGALAPALVVGLVLIGTVQFYRYEKYPSRSAAEWIAENAPETRTMTLGLNRQVMPYYLPEVELLPDAPLDPKRLAGGILIVRDPACLGSRDSGVLRDFCRPPVEFRSSGYRNRDIFLYLCD